MKMYITEGMFGKPVKLLAEDDSTDKLFEELNLWLKTDEAKKICHVSPYMRTIQKEDGTKAVDFGDYSIFGLITI